MLELFVFFNTLAHFPVNTYGEYGKCWILNINIYLSSPRQQPKYTQTTMWPS